MKINFKPLLINALLIMSWGQSVNAQCHINTNNISNDNIAEIFNVLRCLNLENQQLKSELRELHTKFDSIEDRVNNASAEAKEAKSQSDETNEKIYRMFKRVYTSPE